MLSEAPVPVGANCTFCTSASVRKSCHIMQSSTSSNQTSSSGLIRPTVVSLLLFTILLGLVYPTVITGIAQLVFPNQANGSLIKDASGVVIGSALIGQELSDPAHFWGRLSATGPVPYNAAASSGSNYGPLNP